MGVEVAGFEVAQSPIETKNEGDSSLLHEKENGTLNLGPVVPVVNEPIKFGSHGDEPVKAEGNINVSVSDFPKDAVDEWPEPKQIHNFYFVKYRLYEDPKLKAQLDSADKEIQRKNEARAQIQDKIRAKRSERAQVVSELRSLIGERKQFKSIIEEKTREMEPLQQAMGKLRNSRGERGVLCSSEEELDNLIHSLHYRMQHESIPLSEEKQLVKDIKQLEQTREKVIANAALRANIQDSLGQKRDIQDQAKIVGTDLDGAYKDKRAIRAKIQQLESTQKALEKEIDSIQKDLDAVTVKRDETYKSFQQLWKQRDEGNAAFFQYRSLLIKAKELATNRDIKALEELSLAQVEKFMSLWSSSKAARDDYEKRILSSLDFRQLSRDGRMRNPDEKPLVVVEKPAPVMETVAKANPKRSKEDVKPPVERNTPNAKKVKEEVNKKPKDSGIIEDHGGIEDKEIISEPPQKVSSAEKEVDVAKLKEMKIQEEKEKAKQALERKKKLAEKAAAKAAIRAQKEAEKKLKDREKKAKKKASVSEPASDLEEPTEAVSEVAEPEMANLNAEGLVPQKTKEPKEHTVRYRSRSKGADSLPKAILKRKKSTNYWVWAAPAALVVLIILLALGYHYLF